MPILLPTSYPVPKPTHWWTAKIPAQSQLTRKIPKWNKFCFRPPAPAENVQLHNITPTWILIVKSLVLPIPTSLPQRENGRRLMTKKTLTSTLTVKLLALQKATSLAPSEDDRTWAAGLKPNNKRGNAQRCSNKQGPDATPWTVSRSWWLGRYNFGAHIHVLGIKRRICLGIAQWKHSLGLHFKY